MLVRKKCKLSWGYFPQPHQSSRDADLFSIQFGRGISYSLSFLSSLCAEKTRLQFGNTHIRAPPNRFSDDHEKTLAVIFAKQSVFLPIQQVAPLILTYKSVLAAE